MCIGHSPCTLSTTPPTLSLQCAKRLRRCKSPSRPRPCPHRTDQAGCSAALTQGGFCQGRRRDRLAHRWRCPCAAVAASAWSPELPAHPFPGPLGWALLPARKAGSSHPLPTHHNWPVVTQSSWLPPPSHSSAPGIPRSNKPLQ